MDYAFETAWNKFRETLSGCKMVELGKDDPPVGYDFLSVEEVLGRFLRAYPKFEECREKLLARLKSENPNGEMKIHRACQLAR
jgi:hypothetical protein